MGSRSPLYSAISHKRPQLNISEYQQKAKISQAKIAQNFRGKAILNKKPQSHIVAIYKIVRV